MSLPFKPLMPPMLVDFDRYGRAFELGDGVSVRPFRFEIRRLEAYRDRLLVGADLADRDTAEPRRVDFHVPFELRPGLDRHLRPLERAHAVRRGLLWVLEHEVAELIHVDGSRVFEDKVEADHSCGGQPPGYSRGFDR